MVPVLSPAQLPPQSPDRVRTRFLRIVFNRLDEANATLVGDSAHQIVQFVDGGIKTLESSGMKPPDVSRADDNLRLFGDQLVIKGRADTNVVRVDAGVIAAVRKAICPLFPFC